MLHLILISGSPLDALQIVFGADLVLIASMIAYKYLIKIKPWEGFSQVNCDYDLVLLLRSNADGSMNELRCRNVRPSPQ